VCDLCRGLDISQIFWINGLVAVLLVFPFVYDLRDPSANADARVGRNIPAKFMT
jgi:hypothetical protein